MLQKCIYCGCTDTRACAGGCSWHKPDYCSACAELHLEQLVDAVSVWPGTPANAMVAYALCGRSCSIEEGDESLRVLDHIGAVVFSFGPQGVYLAPQYDALEVQAIFSGEAHAL